MTSETIEKTVIRIEADVKKALDEINRVKSEVSGIDKTTSTTSANTQTAGAAMAMSWAAVAAAVAAAGAAVVAIGAKFAMMASEEEKVNVQTAALLTGQGIMWEDASSHLNDYMKNMEKLTAYNDTELQLAFNELLTQGLSYNEALRQMNAVTDLAYSKNISLHTSAQLLGRAYNGQTESLTRYGIRLKEGQNLLEYIDQNMADATTRSQTFDGALKNLKNQMSNVAEGIGDQMLPSLTAMTSTVGDVVTSMYQNINFDAIGKEFEKAFTLAKNLFDDFRRGLTGVDLSGFEKSLKLVAGGIMLIWNTLERLNVFEYVGKAVRLVIEGINKDLDMMATGAETAINIIIEAYNLLVPSLQKIGMDIDYIKKISLDQSLSRYLNSANDAADKAKSNIEDVTDAVNALSSASSNSKIPGWAGQSDYIRERLKEIGGKNIDDMLAAGGIPSSIGGSQTVGGVIQANVSASVSAPMVSLVDINRSGFSTLAMKLDGVIAAVNSIQIRVGGGSFGKSAPKSLKELTEGEFKTQALKNPMYNFSASRYLP